MADAPVPVLVVTGPIGAGKTTITQHIGHLLGAHHLEEVRLAGELALVASGLLVGVGTRYGSGCTSGHGVCGLSRLSPRSLVATLVFMGAGFATVFVMRHLLGL